MTDSAPKNPNRPGGGYDPQGPEFSDPGHRALSESLTGVFRLVPAGMAVILVMFVATGIYRVKQEEWAIRLRLGRAISVDDSGWYIGLPYPIDEKLKLPRRPLSLRLNDFWYGPRLQRESDAGLQTPTALGLDPLEDGYLLTGDRQIVHMNCTLTYRIADPLKFYRNVGGGEMFPVAQRSEPSEELERFLRGIAMPAIRIVIARYTIDEVYQTTLQTALGDTGTSGPMLEAIYGEASALDIDDAPLEAIIGPGLRRARRQDITLAVQNAIQAEFERLETGLVLTDFSFSAEPPVGVNVAFSDVIRASANRGTRVSQAQAEASNIRRDAEQAAARLIRDAQIYRTTTAASASARAEQVRRLDTEYDVRGFRHQHGSGYPPALAAFLELRRIEAIAALVDSAQEIILVSADPDDPTQEVRIHLNRDPQAMRAYRRFIRQQEEEARRRARIIGGTQPQ